MALSPDLRASLATEIGQKRHEIATDVSDKTFKAAYWELRYGAQGRVTCFNDNLKNIDVFALAVRNNSPMIADTHVQWLRDIYINLGMCSTFLSQSFSNMQESGAGVLSPQASQTLNQILDHAKKSLAYDDPLCQQIVRHQDAIVELVTDTMYDGTPYWVVRYGEGGRTSCSIDTYYNIAYVVDALGTKNHKGILIHTRWMRDFLISRGMCSEYYSLAFSLLKDAVLSVVDAEHHERVNDLHEEVQRNLLTNHPFEQAVHSKRREIVGQVVTGYYDRNERLKARVPRQLFARDVLHKVSYLTDAVTENNPAIFLDHIEWTRNELPRLSITLDELHGTLAAIGAALPSNAPQHVYEWLRPVEGVAPQASLPQPQLDAIVDDIWDALHNNTSIWASLLRQEGWRTQLETATIYCLQAPDAAALHKSLGVWMEQTEAVGLPRTYQLDFVWALRSAAQAHLQPAAHTALTSKLDDALAALTEEDAALALVRIPNLTAPVLDTLQQYSPYWQVNFDRRSTGAIENDVRVIVGFLANELMEIPTANFMGNVDLHRRYMLLHGICTAYYQQMLDCITEVAHDVLDAETVERAVVLLEAANAMLETEHPVGLAIADAQDNVVDFVIDYLRQNHGNWVSYYPGGWDDATTDMYYWLAYLTDTVTLNNPKLLAAHVGWLQQYNRQQGNDAEHIRVSLIALGHGIKQHLPNHANTLIALMKPSLERLGQG